jgi:asparagine synthase (glutamine-hydrolysing)
LSGICGWYGDAGGDAASSIEKMQHRFAWRGARHGDAVIGPRFALAALGPEETAAVFHSGPIHLAVQGHPSWSDGAKYTTRLDEFCRRMVAGYLERGCDALESIGGDFALAIIDERDDQVTLAIDRIGVRNIHYQHSGSNLIFGASGDVVGAHPLAARSISSQAVYDYVYFHMVPGPATIFEEQRRLIAGHCLRFDHGHLSLQRYWQIRFDENERGSVETFKPAFRSALQAGVTAAADERQCGTFLSGGTDSSTVTGMLGEVSGAPPRTYSIGFEAAGYDEMEYARIAARHFKARHHEYYVTPADVVQAMPLIAAAYDQPFGNASAVPTYYCAKLAQADGVERMLGGDGGDELFGGNTRYARQYQLALYERLPASLRRKLIEPLLLGGPDVSRIPLLRKARSYVEQARLPMPARYETYNLLERLGPANVFAADFLAEVDRSRPLAELQAAYASTDAQSLINHLLALDLKFTLADNDLPKVTRMCELASVDVAFPLLHESVVDFSTRLPPDFKLRGTRLRYFFKEALRDFLPPETIAKQKHGFGLPAGVWLRDFAPLNQLAGDALASLRTRKIFRGDLLDDLMTKRLHEHPGYYGTLAWVLMMLELWFQKHSAA